MSSSKDRYKEPDSFAKIFLSTVATTSKQLMWLFSVSGVLWIWCSYALAFLGKAQIAETLSTNVCTVIIGQMAMYLITSTIENIFKYNDIFNGKSSGKELSTGTVEKASEAAKAYKLPSTPLITVDQISEDEGEPEEKEPDPE